MSNETQNQEWYSNEKLDISNEPAKVLDFHVQICQDWYVHGNNHRVNEPARIVE